MRICAGIEPSQKEIPRDRTTIFGARTRAIKTAETQGFFAAGKVFP
jgi:hypothetical protein